MDAESRKKDNIVSLAWWKVVCPLAKAADPVSWIILACFIALLVTALVLRFGASGAGHDFYMAHYPYFWYGSWALLVLSTVGPIFNLVRERNEVPLGVLVGVAICHLATFILMGVLALSETENVAAITALLAATAAAVMVGVGWVVQHQSTARAARRAHTFNILMQSRLSGEFQGQVKLRGTVYSAGKKVTAADAELINVEGYQKRCAEVTAELAIQLKRSKPESHDEIREHAEAKLKTLKEKHESMQGLKYLLNFYEFMCAAIVLRELDEPMLRETVKDIAISLYEDSVHVRQFSRESQPDVFKNLDRVIGAWWTKGQTCP